MVTVRVEGYMTPEGEIKFDLPDELPEGNFELVVNVSRRGKTLGEILDSGLVGQGAEAWADEPDTIEWLDQQRRERRERRQS